MAVPKNKRYRQVVRTRRSLQKLNLILKKNLALTKFSNYITTSVDYINTVKCLFCQNEQITTQLCANCYVSIFARSFLIKKDNKNIQKKQKFKVNKYYAKLSKTLFPLSRP